MIKLKQFLIPTKKKILLSISVLFLEFLSVTFYLAIKCVKVKGCGPGVSFDDLLYVSGTFILISIIFQIPTIYLVSCIILFIQNKIKIKNV